MKKCALYCEKNVLCKNAQFRLLILPFFILKMRISKNHFIFLFPPPTILPTTHKAKILIHEEMHHVLRKTHFAKNAVSFTNFAASYPKSAIFKQSFYLLPTYQKVTNQKSCWSMKKGILYCKKTDFDKNAVLVTQFFVFTLKMRMEFCLTNFELYLIKPWLKKATKKGGVGGRIYYLVKNDLGRGPSPLALFTAHCHKHSLKNKKFIKKSWPNCWCIVNTCFNFPKSPQNHLNLTILRGRYGTNFDKS